MKKLLFTLSLFLFGANVNAEIVNQIAYENLKANKSFQQYRVVDAPKMLYICTESPNDKAGYAQFAYGGRNMNEVIDYVYSQCPPDRLHIVAFQKSNSSK